MKTLIIGENAKIINYQVKQRGYGRQSLYVDIMYNNSESIMQNNFKEIKGCYIKDVFPNVLEHYQDSYYLEEYSFYDEENEVYRRDSGNGEYTEDCIFKTIEDMLNHALKGYEIEIEEENL